MKTEGLKEAVLRRLAELTESVERDGLNGMEKNVAEAASLDALRGHRDTSLPDDLMGYIVYDTAYDLQEKESS